MAFDWKNLVSSVAPSLGAALGGPLGGMAGKLISDALGVDKAKIPDIIAEADPETFAKLKAADHEFQVKLQELDIDLERVNQKDRESARHLATSTSLLPQAIISGIFITGFIVVLYLVFTGGVDLAGTMKDAALLLLGILSAGITQIMNFFFGSSTGSKQKTTIMGGKQ